VVKIQPGMHLKPFFFLAIYLLIVSGIAAQPIQLKWLLDLEADATPTGIPDQTYFHYVKEGKLIRMSEKGEVQEMNYEEATHLKGPYWQVVRQKRIGVWHNEMGEIIPPVYSSLSMAVTKDGPCWAFAVTKYGMSAIINEKNQVIKDWSTSGFSSLNILGDTVLEYKKANAIAFMSQLGYDLKESQVKWLKPPEFKRLSADKFIFSYFKAGKERVDTFSNAEAFSGGIAAVAVKNQWGYISDNGSWIIRPQFQSAGPFNEYGFAVVKVNGGYSLIKKDGKPIFTPKFAFLKHFNRGLYEFKEGDQIGLCDTTGKIILPSAQYASFIPAGNQVIAAQFPNKNLKFYTILGEPLPLDSIVECKGSFSSSAFVAAIQNNKKQKLFGLLDPKGNWVQPPVFSLGFHHYSHYFVSYGKINQPELLQGIQADKAQDNQKLIYNLQGAPVLNYPVSNFIPVKDSPIAVFELNKLFGLITPDGLLLEPVYHSIKPVGNNWFYVERGGKFGVVKCTP
jgi:hypothetical protein